MGHPVERQALLVKLRLTEWRLKNVRLVRQDNDWLLVMSKASPVQRQAPPSSPKRVSNKRGSGQTAQNQQAHSTCTHAALLAGSVS